MITPNTPTILPTKVQEAIIQYHHQCYNLQATNWNIREQMRKIDLAYQREADQTSEHWKARLANRYGDKTKFQNVTVPVIMPMVEAAVTYQASVFLTGNPLFGVVSNPANADAALQMESVIGDQQIKGGWTREFILFFRDAFKYNLAAIEVDWDRMTTPAFETDLSFSTREGRPKEVVWEGNVIKRCDPYNLIFDTRVAPSSLYYKGEFVGYNKLMSRVALKEFINTLPNKMVSNVVAAFESGMGFSGITMANSVGGYYIPEVNPEALLNRNPRATTNWLAWAGITGQDNKIKYKDMYELTKLYAKIIPSDFGLKVPSANTPQIWKFYIVNHQVVIYAERQTNAHGFLPILLCQPLEDGLEFQTKSLAQNVSPIQDLTSALWNSNIAARRRSVSDRGLYDPSRVTEANINSDNPSAKIPVRPAAYGKPVSEAYYPIPFRDDQAGLVMQETASLMQMANMITGQNPARQGQFVKGNKTQREFDSVMSNANGRDQLVSILLEDQIFLPLKHIIKTNILQYQGGGSVFNRDKKQAVNVDPVALRKAILEFKVSDGLIPADKLISADTLQVAMQVIGSTPALLKEYNLSPMFSYMIKTQGGDIGEFEKSPEQVAYEDAVAQWQNMANSVLELAKSVTLKVENVTMDQVKSMIQELLPPQPVPQSFNYDPTMRSKSGQPPAAPTNQPQQE